MTTFPFFFLSPGSDVGGMSLNCDTSLNELSLFKANLYILLKVDITPFLRKLTHHICINLMLCQEQRELQWDGQADMS